MRVTPIPAVHVDRLSQRACAASVHTFSVLVEVLVLLPQAARPITSAAHRRPPAALCL
jgi:hypothetical protein